MTLKKCRHLISLNDISDTDLMDLVQRGLSFSDQKVKPDSLLKGLIIGIYFRKTSTRTRTAFSTAALQMGANIISYGPNDLQENTGECIDDTTRVLSRMLNGFVARTAGSSSEMRTFASQTKMGVINAMTEDEHPTQALADLTTMLQHFRELSALRILYLGEGNNTATALALSVPRIKGTELYFYTPPGYEVPRATIQQARHYAQHHGAQVHESECLNKLPSEVDVIYTTRWETTGTVKHDSNWKDKFQPFRIDEQLMNKYPKAVFMHDLPAHRGEEVQASVIDGPRSIAFDQAENKLHSAKAVLEWCLTSASAL